MGCDLEMQAETNPLLPQVAFAMVFITEEKKKSKPGWGLNIQKEAG